MTFTQEQLDQLAVFAGLTVGPNENWYYCNTSSAQMLMFCRRQEWRPHLKPEQWWLVLDVWVKKDSWDRVLIQLVRKNMACDDTDKTFDIMNETCLVALEMIAKEPTNDA